ncbi:MAG: hypothetical protein Tsb004_20660 [Allomuricauda sp.]
MKVEVKTSQLHNKYIIYKATNKINNKVYIGASTTSLETRKNDHVNKSKGTNRTTFQKAIGTFGPDAFTWEILDYATTTDELALKERCYIKRYNSYSNGYNSDSGGGFKKKVYKFDEIYGLIGVYSSLSIAALTVFGRKTSVSNVSLGNCKSYKGYYWSYDKNFKVPNDTRKKRVGQYDLENRLVQRFDSVAEASRCSGLSKSSISRVCRNERKQAGGFIWTYE